MKNLLLFILLVLVVFQSTVAVADMHEAHQTGQEHLQFDHPEEINNKEITLVTDYSIDTYPVDNSDQEFSFDCHHCCHCHGVACNYLENHQNAYVSIFESSSLFENQTFFTSRTTPPSLRPPIV